MAAQLTKDAQARHDAVRAVACGFYLHFISHRSPQIVKEGEVKAVQEESLRLQDQVEAESDAIRQQLTSQKVSFTAVHVVSFTDLFCSQNSSLSKHLWSSKRKTSHRRKRSCQPPWPNSKNRSGIICRLLSGFILKNGRFWPRKRKCRIWTRPSVVKTIRQLHSGHLMVFIRPEWRRCRR